MPRPNTEPCKAAFLHKNFSNAAFGRPVVNKPAADVMTRVSCCIAGGGPAGMMLGYLLARAGVEVLVLEKHADFLRDFRGDTVHPSTLEVIHELGLLDVFLRLPHEKIERVALEIGRKSWPVADFSRLPTRCKFIALMPQWDFLNFLATEAKRFPAFDLRMGTEATGLIEEGDQIVGLRATDGDGEFEVRSDLVVVANGRGSALRDDAGLTVDDLGAPMDALWFKMPRRPDDPGQLIGRFAAGRIFVLIDRGDYWQCAYVIPKGSFDRMRARDFDEFRDDVARHVPMLADRVDKLQGWDDVKLLTVGVDRLRRWYRPGLLCIGDAAHTMSPIGGVGINLAIQDAVAAANRLAAPLREQRLEAGHLRGIQQRRQWPTRATQRFQVLIQNRVIGNVLEGRRGLKPPWPVRLTARFPALRRIPARLIGLGFRPEHVEIDFRT